MDKHRVYGCICFNIQGWRFQVNPPTSSQLLPSHDDVSIRSQPILHDRCVHSDEGVEVAVFKEWQGGPGGLLTARVSRFGCKSRSSRGKSWQSFSNELLFAFYSPVFRPLESSRIRPYWELEVCQHFASSVPVDS